MVVSDVREDKSRADCQETSTKRRKVHWRRRKAATMHASPIDNKGFVHEEKVVNLGVVLEVDRKDGRAHDNNILRATRQKSVVQRNLQARRFVDADNIMFLTEMLSVARSDVGQSVRNKDIDWGQLHRKINKRFQHDYTRIQVYEKARKLKSKYLSMFLKKSAGQHTSFKDANKEEIYSLSQQIWGDCGVLRLHLEEDDEDRAVLPHDRLENSPRDVASSHQDDSHGLEAGDTGARENVERDNIAMADRDRNVPFVKEVHVTVEKSCQILGKKPVGDLPTELRSPTTEWNAQTMYEVLHSEHRELLKALQNKCVSVFEEMQVNLMTMVNSATKETRNQASVGSFLDTFQTAALVSADNFLGKLRAAPRNDCGKPISDYLRDRWQQLRIEELRLMSDRLQLMLEECQIEQAKMERQARKP